MPTLTRGEFIGLAANAGTGLLVPRFGDQLAPADDEIQRLFDDAPIFDGVVNWERWKNVARHLRERGFSLEDLRKVLGANFLRVYREVLDP